MSNHHFSYFRVKNFKRFKDLEVKDIGQFNLVLGDNNVGKTSLLEGLTVNGLAVNEDPYSAVTHILLNLIKCYSFRNVGQVTHEYFLRYFGDLTGSQKESIITFSFHNINQRDFTVQISNNLHLYRKIHVKIEGEKEIGPYAEDSLSIENLTNIASHKISFIPFANTFDSNWITTFYSETIQRNKKLKEEYLTRIRDFFKEIESLEPSTEFGQPTLIAYTGITDNSIPIGVFGEGTIKLIMILSYLFTFKQKLVLIDEIDAGIHYSRMKDYWKVILQSAKENDVQIFATTHNRECIQYFIEAMEELGDEYKSKARAIRLVEHAQTKEVISFTSSLEEISADFAVGNELR